MDQLGIGQASNVFSQKQIEASLLLALNCRDGKQGDGISEGIDPYTKAVNYLENHQILNHMEAIATKVCFEKPQDPLDFILKEFEELKSK